MSQFDQIILEFQAEADIDLQNAARSVVHLVMVFGAAWVLVAGAILVTRERWSARRSVRWTCANGL